MVNDPHTTSAAMGQIANGRRLLERKWKSLKTSENQVGLLPTEGWRKRNLQFLGDVLLPTLLARRADKHEGEPFPTAQKQELAITWLGHAGFLIQQDGKTILVDPNLALWHGPVKRVRHPSFKVADLPPVDLVLITHAHYDHLHLPTLKRVAAGQPIVLPTGCGDLVQRCNFSRIIELRTWEGYGFQDLRITLTPARHWGARMIHDTHRHFGGYLIQGADRTVYHCGDSALFDGFKEIGERAAIDVALMPIGAYEAPSGRPVHMNPEEALDAFTQLGAGIMIPMHYDTFPLGAEPLNEPAERLWTNAIERKLHERVLIMREGQSLLL